MLAELNFVPPMPAAPMLNLTASGRGNVTLDPQTVEISDADALDPPATLASHGFTAVPFTAPKPDEHTEAAYRQIFANLAADALKKELGATVCWGMPGSVQVRNSGASNEQAPIAITHTDFTPTKAAALAQAISSRAPRLHGRPLERYAAFNVWWLAREGPQDRPLALCDAATIAAADLQIGQADMMSPDKVTLHQGIVTYMRHSPKQRWYWYPNLGPDRLLLFSGFDSDASMPTMVTHSAFTNSECPPDAPPRVSVECRCFAFW